MKTWLAESNFSTSMSSLAKALAVRTPEMLDSMAAVISAVFFLTSILAFFMRMRWLRVNQSVSGRTMASTRARRH